MKKCLLLGLGCGILLSTGAYAVDEVDFGLDDEIFVEEIEKVSPDAVKDNVELNKDSFKEGEAIAQEEVDEVIELVNQEANNAKEEAEKNVDSVVLQVREMQPAVVVSENVVLPEAEKQENMLQAENKVVSDVAVEKDTEDVLSESEVQGEDVADEMDLSYYVQKLNLSVEQLDLAKYISDDGRLKQEQLLKSILLLRKQAHDLEAKSLEDFEAILTDEQREQFLKLREAYEKKHSREILDLDHLSEVAPKVK